MSAWIEGKKRTGPWKIRWREMIGGKWVKKSSRTFHNMSEVRQECDAVNKRLEHHATLLPRKNDHLLSIDTLIAKWRSASIAAGKIRPHYADEFTDILTKLCRDNGWAHTNHITAAAIDHWRENKARGHTKPTAMLKTLLRWSAATHHQPVDPYALILPTKKPTPRPSPPLLTPEQVNEIIRRAFSFSESIGAAIQHLSIFGCRPADIVRLNVGDWNSQQRTLTLQKTKSRTRPTPPIDNELSWHAEQLNKLTHGRKPDEPLFTNPQGERWRVDRHGSSRQIVDWYYSNITDKIQDLLPQQRGIQCLKDYAITIMDAAGIDDATKQGFTGHQTTSVYDRYKETNRQRLLSALEKIAKFHTAPKGANLGAKPNSEGKTAAKPPNRPKPKSKKTA